MVNLLARLGRAITASDFCDFCRAGIMLFRALIGKPEFRKQCILLNEATVQCWCSVATDHYGFWTFLLAWFLVYRAI